MMPHMRVDTPRSPSAAAWKLRTGYALSANGHLGGAIAAHARIGSPLLSHSLFGVYLRVLLSAGLYLRDPGVRALRRLPRPTFGGPP